MDFSWDEEDLQKMRKGEFLDSIEQSCNDCQIFIDNMGEMVLCPQNAREGDVVCEITGAAKDAICILRQRSDSGWTLIGVTHI